jgi:hypothetical protein
MAEGPNEPSAGVSAPRADVPWKGPTLSSGLLLITWSYHDSSPVWDAASLTAVSGFHLVHPPLHVLLTPLTSVADYLTVMSVPQLGMFLSAVLALFFFFWPLRRAVLASLLMSVFLAWGTLVPRPMSRLVPEDADVLLIDFHSHSNVSHDARPWFTPERNRRWHAAQGYGAGFLTDHNRVEGAVQAKEASRLDWRVSGFRSLQGEEISLYKMHLVVLGNREWIDNRPYDSDPAKIPAFIRDMSAKGYVVIASLPEYWQHQWGAGVEGMVAAGVSGFELISSAPKALAFPRSLRASIVRRCREKNLVLTGISDNHGLGFATAAWNAMRIPGWQLMDPDRLEAAVLSRLKSKRYEAVQVLERRRLLPEKAAEWAFSPISGVAIYLRNLSGEQLLAWIFWIWTPFVWRQTRLVTRWRVS